jgi:hypothetical protein
MFFHLPFSTGNLWFVLGQIYPYHLKYLSIKFILMKKLNWLVLRKFYKNIARENRICPLCNNGEIGDEFHYLFKCQ